MEIKIDFFSYIFLNKYFEFQAACKANGATLASSDSDGLAEFLKADKVLKRKKFIILNSPKSGSSYVFASDLNKISKPKRRAPAVCKKTPVDNQEMIITVLI